MIYRITHTVDSSEKVWTADTLDAIMKQWIALGPLEGLTLWFGEQKVTTLLGPFVSLETQKGPARSGA